MRRPCSRGMRGHTTHRWSPPLCPRVSHPHVCACVWVALQAAVTFLEELLVQGVPAHVVLDAALRRLHRGCNTTADVRSVLSCAVAAPFLHPTAMTLHAVLSACGRVGDEAAALTWLPQLVAKGARADVGTLRSVQRLVELQKRSQ